MPSKTQMTKLKLIPRKEDFFEKTKKRRGRTRAPHPLVREGIAGNLPPRATPCEIPIVGLE